MDTTANTRDVTEATFEQDVVAASHTRPVVVDFWAPWCGPCHQLSPIIERVAARHAGDVDLVKVNVDEAPNLSRRYRVQGIPAVKAFSGGAVVSEFTGVQPEAAVEQFFAGLTPSEADRLVQQALEAPQQAEELLTAAIDAEPGHTRANLELARRHLDAGRPDDARLLLERVAADPEAKRLLARLNLAAVDGDDDLDELRRNAESGSGEAQLRLGRRLAAAEQYDEALRWLVAAVKDPVTRDAARSAAVEVFALLGDDHELVRAWRPRLSSALF